MAKKPKKLPYPIDPRARRIIGGMAVWFDGSSWSRKKSAPDGRSVQQQAFDSGVFTAAEFVRRVTGDETLAMMVHECCTWRQKELAEIPHGDDGNG